MSAKGTTVHKHSPFYDGPPIERCPTFAAMIEDAIVGSQKLLRAQLRAGVRP